MTALDVDASVATRRSILVPAVPLALAGFTLLTVLFFWPWLAHLSSALIGPPEDNMQDFWNSWHAATAHGWRDFLFTDQIRYPEGTTLSYHSFAWPQIAAIMLLSHLFGADIPTLTLLHNLTLLASFPLAAMAMFALARHLLGNIQGRDAGAAVAGFIFAFNPWHVAQTMHHAHVASIEFLPLFVLFYLRALDARNWRLVAVAAALLALSALSCWYYLFYGFYFMAFQLLYLRIHEGRWPRGWALAVPAVSLGGAALLLLPWLVPMTGADAPVKLGSNLYVADLLALVAFPPTHFLAQASAGLYARLTGNPWEDAVYLGLVNIAVLVWAMTRKTDKRLLQYALGGMIFFALIAAGETLHVGGRVTLLGLPNIVLDKLPFFANVRTPARAMVMVYLFLGLGLGQALVMALRHRTAVARVTLSAAAVLMLLDFTPTNLAATPLHCPAALNVIAEDPANVGVLDLPRGYNEGSAVMMLSVCHGHPIVAGETSRKLGVTLDNRLVTADLAAQRRQLVAAHVKYVVLHSPKDGLFLWAGADGRPADYMHAYRPVSAGDGLTVLRVY